MDSEPKSLYNADIRFANLKSRYDVIVLPDQSSRQFMQGFTIGIVPGQYVGGVGEDGLNHLREFVREGGTLIALNRTSSTLNSAHVSAGPECDLREQRAKSFFVRERCCK